MSKTLVQINFNYEMHTEEMQKATGEFIEVMKALEGLLWKIWIVNEQERITGGIYLFKDEPSARAYAEGPIVDRLRHAPGYNNLCVHVFGILEVPSRATYAPV